jgi:hypothetical protein
MLECLVSKGFPASQAGYNTVFQESGKTGKTVTVAGKTSNNPDYLHVNALCVAW